ncbi:MAG: LysR family transcriptional regulator [Oscillospiraceae bacterium]|nr:LysR family transcriptional regulator [Oscillospiraceae bacterium]
MNIESLIYFYNAAQGKTYLDISEQYNISQSSISKMIHQLEQEFQTKLFEKSGRTLKLTKAGNILYRDLQMMMPYYEKLREDMMMSSKATHISVYVRPSIQALHLRAIVDNFMERYPWITVTLRDDRKPGKIVDLLSNKEVDYIITHRPPHGYDGYREIVLADDHIIALLPKDHPMAQGDSTGVRMESLQNELFHLIRRTNNLLDTTCWTLNVTVPQYVMTNMNREELLWSVERDHIVSIAYESDIKGFNLDGIAYKRILGLPSHPYVFVCSRQEELDHDNMLFLNYLIDHVE